MNITEKDIKNLTPEHRVVWKNPDAPREYELGLWEDEGGNLRTDAVVVVRWGNGTVPEYALNRIVRVIPPFTPRRGLVIGSPDFGCWLVCFKPDKWYGPAGVIVGTGPFTDTEARNLIENHGWKVVDDLTNEASDD